MIVIPGFTPADKTPGAVSINQFGAGRQSIGAIALLCVCFGTMDESAGDVTPDLGRVAVFSEEDAAARFGPRSELARMLYAALDIPGVALYGCAVDAPGGAAAATVTLSLSGLTWTGSGEFTLRLDEEVIRIAIGTTVLDDMGQDIADAINQAQQGKLFCSAAYNSTTDVVTITVNSAGVRGNQHTAWLDLAEAPAGFTPILAGGSALANGGVPFTGGSGSDNLDTILTNVGSVQNDYIALAHNDATNVGKIKTHVNAKAAYDVGLLEHYVVSTNGTSSAAITLAQTNMNDQLGRIAYVQFGVEHPSRLAARIAATFSVTDGAQPNTNYDGVVVEGAAPNYRPADSPNRALKNALLNAGVTPLETVGDELRIVRAITSRSLNGSTPDYRTLDHGESVVPVRVRKELLAVYDEMRQNAPWAGPDVGTDPPPDGVFTPNLWKSRVLAELKVWESPAFNWLTEVDDNPPEAEWDSAAKRVMSIVPTIVRPLNHQIGIVVRQIAA